MVHLAFLVRYRSLSRLELTTQDQPQINRYRVDRSFLGPGTKESTESRKGQVVRTPQDLEAPRKSAAPPKGPQGLDDL